MKKSLIATAVLLTFTALSPAHAVAINTWNSSIAPAISDSSLSYTGNSVTNDIWGAWRLFGRNWAA